MFIIENSPVGQYLAGIESELKVFRVDGNYNFSIYFKGHYAKHAVYGKCVPNQILFLDLQQVLVENIFSYYCQNSLRKITVREV